ncbi:acyl transferase/acyl hydrolase/lysophospholipase [Haematococcus lacustris]
MRRCQKQPRTHQRGLAQASRIGARPLRNCSTSSIICPRVATSSRCRVLGRQRILCFQGASGPATLAQPAGESTALDSKQKLAVSWAGAGVFFFWQLGAMKFLAQRYDLTKVPMAGASGGSLAAVLAACGVDADSVIEKAYQMSVKHRVWERPLALLGTWSKFIEQWLDELLPDNAHEVCRGRITVVVTTLPDWVQVGISDFKDKKDLINACMASSHVPFFLDLKLSRPCRGRLCVDGSFPDFFTGLNSELLTVREGGPAVVFDYFDDRALPRKGRMDMLEVKSYDEIRKMYQLGYEYAAKLHADGRFDHYELAEVLLQVVNAAGCRRCWCLSTVGALALTLQVSLSHHLPWLPPLNSQARRRQMDPKP